MPPGPPELGRGVVVRPGADVPAPWHHTPVVVVDDAALADPAPVVAALRSAWVARAPVVVELAADPARFRAPPEVAGEPWRLDAGLRLWEEELQFLVWSNTYDARAGEPVWWWARKAERAGARPCADPAAGDVVVAGAPAWVDGGPRRPFEGLRVLHRERVERGLLEPEAAPVAPADDLAADQLAAVAHLSGPARVVAPAGSGKTRVLTARLRHLLVDRGWEGAGVLAVAYNKKAQEELEARCGDLRPRTRTLNSLGLWVLTEARGRQPAVLVERDVRRLVDRLAPRRQRRSNTDPVGPYLEAMGRVRLALVDPEQVEAERDDVPGLAGVYDGFRGELASSGAVDFDEQVYGAVAALLADGALRARLQGACRHLLVDEFQDLTPAHVLLLRLLAGPAADVFGVGDDDQVIYGYAGADPGYLIDYADHFPGASAHALEVNHRCPPEVVESAASLLSYNHRRVAKAIRPGRVAGAEPGLVVRAHAGGEGAASAVEVVGGWLGAGAEPAAVAVLARVRSALLAPAVALGAAGVPTTSTLGPELLERTGLRAALAYLRIATAPDDGIAPADLVEVLRRPSRGLPQWFPDRLHRRARWSLATLAGVAASVGDKDATKVERFVGDLEQVRAAAATGADAAAVLAVVRDDIGLGGAMGLLDSSAGGEGSSHLDDLDALAEVAVSEPDPGRLEGWVRAQLSRPDDPAGVTVSTVHRVKGMEWDRVAVYGVTAGLVPHRLAADVEEERRILHVAVTRARLQAVVLADRGRPSPFLAELAGTAPHQPAPPAAPGRRPGRPGPVAERGPRPVEARVGLQLTVAGGFSGTITAVDAEGATLTLDSGAGLRVRVGEPVSIRGRDLVLAAPVDLPAEVAAAEAGLRAWRAERARQDRVPAYIVFPDKTLRAIATARPGTLAALRRVDGIGPTKLDSYGEEVLAVLAGLPDATPDAAQDGAPDATPDGEPVPGGAP